MSVAIEVRGVHRNFGDVKALDGVDLEIAEGAVFGLLGPNGAGKTTLIRILTTLLRPTSGEARVLGLDVVRDAVQLRSRIGLAGQSAAVDEALTGFENVDMVGRLYNLNGREVKQRADEVLERIGLTAAARRPVRTYSGGMRRRLDLAASLVGRPDVLLMDEPTTGLDPASRLEVWALMGELVDEGTTLLLTTQYLEEADRLADRVAVIDHGKVITEGTPNELKTRMADEVLDVTLADAADLERAIALLSELCVGEPSVDSAVATISLTLGDDKRCAIRALRILDENEIRLINFSLRQPTLDEVFLRLTGSHIDEELLNGNGVGPRRRRRNRRGT